LRRLPNTQAATADNCLYALQDSTPQLTRSSLHRLFARHGISRLPDPKAQSSPRRTFKFDPIGYFHIDIAELRTEDGKLCMFVALGRTSSFISIELCEKPVG